MTALCSGGPSAPKSGIGGVLTVGAAAIEVFISSILGLPELAPVLAPIIAGLVDIELAVYCATDPPADPGLSATDVADAIQIPPGLGTFAAQQKILTWFEAHYWYQICNCTGTTTPGPPTPSNPGQVSSNPGIPANTTAPCWTVSIPWQVPANHSNLFSSWVDLTPQALPPGVYQTFPLETGTFPYTGNATVIPVGVTNMQLSTVFNEVIATSGDFVDMHWYDFTSSVPTSAQNMLHNRFTSTTAAGSITGVAAALPLGAQLWALDLENFDTVAHSGTTTLSFFCPPGTNLGQPCCPPDPLLEGELQQILQYVQAIYAGLPIPPNSFAEGTVHSGLTGNGSITFSGVPIALKVDLTTIPSSLGRQIGDPEFYFDVGYLSFGTSEGNYAQERLSLEHQVVTVPVLAGSVGYTLLSGTVVTITELLPGP